MILKVNCLDFNVDNIKKGIATYREQNNEEPDYLIMSEETSSELSNRSDLKVTHELPKKFRYYYSDFWGIPIAICNKLDFGVVIYI